MSLISAMRTAQAFVRVAANYGVTVSTITVYSDSTAAAHIEAATPDYLAHVLNVELQDAENFPAEGMHGKFRKGDIQFHGLEIAVFGKQHEADK